MNCIRWTLAVAVSLLCAGTAGAAATEKAIISISPMPKQGATAADLVQMVQDLRKLGVQGMYVSHKWNELEPAEGKRDLKKLRESLRGLTALGFTVQLTLQTLDTNNRTLPADLLREPFDSPRLRARFAALLKEIAAALPANVRWVSLGNEVDLYLAEHRAEVEAFAGFVEAGRSVLRAEGVKAAVGVTTTFGGMQQHRAVFARLHRNMDFVPMTYYPLGPAFAVRPTADVVPDLGQMARAAGPKPWVLQEAGCPAAPLLGSSEEKQAAFVDALFDAAAQHGGSLQMVNVFLLHDFGDQLVDGFLKYYRLPDPRFRAYLATLGLKQTDGTPRQSWLRFEARTRAWAATGK